MAEAGGFVGRFGRLTVAVVLVSGAAVLASPSSAGALPPEPPPAVDTAPFRRFIPPSFNPFVDDEGVAEGDLECLEAVGFRFGSTGRGTTPLVRPADLLTRDQVAFLLETFLSEALRLDLPGGVVVPRLPPPTELPGPFVDDESGAVMRLAGAGIVRGITPTTFAPRSLATRAQAATMVNRTNAFLLQQVVADTGRTTGFTTTEDFFTDDETGAAAPHEANLNGLASRGILVGDGRDRARPLEPVTKAALAQLLCRSYAVHHADGVLDAAPVPFGSTRTIDVDQTAVTELLGTSRSCAVAIPVGETVDLRIVPSIPTVGGLVFPDDDGDGVADGLPTPVTFAASGTNRLDDVVSPGLVSFTLVSPPGDASPLDVTVVVFRDHLDENDAIDVRGDSLLNAAEEFGSGCRTTFLPPEAPVGPFGGDTLATAVVAYVDPQAHYFVTTAPSRVYEIDLADRYVVDGVEVTDAGYFSFLAQLSAGDAVGGTYEPDGPAPSRFVLRDLTPVPPQIVDASTPLGRAVRIVGPAPSPDVVSYQVGVCEDAVQVCAGGDAFFSTFDVHAQRLPRTVSIPAWRHADGPLTVRVTAVTARFESSPPSNLVVLP